LEAVRLRNVKYKEQVMTNPMAQQLLNKKGAALIIVRHLY